MKGTIIVTRKKGDVFWGILFLLGAVAFLVGKLGFLDGVSIRTILLSIGLFGILLNGLRERSFGQMLFAIAFLIIVNDELLHMEELTPWPVLGAAALATIGLNILFPGFKRKDSAFVNGGEGTTVSEERRMGTTLSYENAFGSSVKYVTGEISAVRLESSFGSTELYFTDAVLVDGAANVSVEVSFGKTVLYVPRDWRVVNNVSRAFGSSGVENGEEGAGNVLYINGEVAFGTLLIERI